MIFRRILFVLTPALLVICMTPAGVLSQGSLVIAGGGLEDDNASVYQQMIDLAGGNEKAAFAVIPSASGVSAQSYADIRSVLISYGVKPDHIHLIRIAMVDDDSTLDVNEAEWSNNGHDPAVAALVRSCSGVWFTGGDQTRTIKTLVNPDGTHTPVLEAVWEVYRSGGVIGGSSAGAAIMSEVMIGGGNSLAALMHGIIKDYTGDDFPEGDGLLMGRGLGFFPLGVVDQHFGQRSRIGRLVVAVMNAKPVYNLGFGIDENTAVIYLGNENLVKIAGAGAVTVIDASGASLEYVEGLPEVKDLIVSILEEGDIYDGNSGKIIPSGGKKPTRGNEYYNNEIVGQAGVLSAGSSRFSELATMGLIDNKGAETIKNISFSGVDSGFMVTLSETPESQGFYTDEPDGEDHYTVVKLKMDIVPVQITVTPLKK
jgi:cyanophycinase